MQLNIPLKATTHFCGIAAVPSLTIGQGCRAHSRWRVLRRAAAAAMMIHIGFRSNSAPADTICALAFRARARTKGRKVDGSSKSRLEVQYLADPCLFRLQPQDCGSGATRRSRRLPLAAKGVGPFGIL